MKYKIAGIIVLALLLIGLGYGLATWRHQGWIAGYTKREAEREAVIKKGEEEQNQLRGENKALRADISKLSAEDEALKAIIESRGGAIAAEAKNLESINNELQNDQAVIKNPTDKCLRCRRFSDRAIANGQISRPLTCKDECAVPNQ